MYKAFTLNTATILNEINNRNILYQERGSSPKLLLRGRQLFPTGHQQRYHIIQVSPSANNDHSRGQAFASPKES